MPQPFPRELTSLAAVFTALEDFARAHGLDAETTGELGVIVEELFTNQVRHAGPATGPIVVDFSVEDGRIVIELRDRGVEPFDPTAAPEVDVDRPAIEREPGGLGIHLVRNLSDSFEWDYDRSRREARIRVTRRLKR